MKGCFVGVGTDAMLARGFGGYETFDLVSGAEGDAQDEREAG